MPQLSLSAGQISEPVEVGPGTRVTATGSGYVEWTTSTLADVRNGIATWQVWPKGSAVGYADTLRRVVMRAVAVGALVVVWEEGKRDEGAEGAYWQEDVPSWAKNSAGNLIGLRGPLAIQTGIAGKLVAMYDAQRVEDEAYGPLLLPRARLTVGDTPTITAGTTIPSSDGTDPAAQRVNTFGVALAGDATLAQKLIAKRWLSGFSLGLRARDNGPANRLSSSVRAYAANGDQDQDTGLGYGIDNNGTYLDVVLDGDILYIGSLSGIKFGVWVNNSRVNGVGVASTGITHDSADETYRISGSAGYIKIKFSSVAVRRITIYQSLAGGIGNVWTRATATVLPWNEQKIRWLHLGDSFSQGSGASHMGVGAPSWMASGFGGWDVDLINAAQGSTGFANASMNLPGAAPVSSQKPSIRQQYLLHCAVNEPVIVTMLIGHNDASSASASFKSELSALLAQIRIDNQSAIIAVFGTNWSPGVNATQVTVEATIASAVGENPGVLWFPLQTNSSGAFMRGTGRVGATVGDGNADLYTGTDTTHPTDAGHRAYGQMMARRLYSALKTQVGL